METMFYDLSKQKMCNLMQKLERITLSQRSQFTLPQKVLLTGKSAGRKTSQSITSARAVPFVLSM